jgi:hypothetical protein
MDTADTYGPASVDDNFPSDGEDAETLIQHTTSLENGPAVRFAHPGLQRAESDPNAGFERQRAVRFKPREFS